MTRMHR